MITHCSLHLIFSPDGWDKAKTLIGADDQILFVQDSVYLLEKEILCHSEAIYARSKDITARNIKPLPIIEVIDDEQWVQLTQTCKNIISW